MARVEHERRANWRGTSKIGQRFGRRSGKDRREQKQNKCIYLMGSLRNPTIPELAVSIRKHGWEVFDDWYSPGLRADDHWRDYAQRRGQSYQTALSSYAATHVFEFDKYHLDRADVGVLVHPAGKSCHLELGYMVGQGKPGIIYWPDGEPAKDRWEVMTLFADRAFSFKELIKTLERYK